jgi:hypothetical protein
VIVRGSVVTCCGGILLLRYGVARELQQECLQRLPKIFTPWLRIVIGNRD